MHSIYRNEMHGVPCKILVLALAAAFAGGALAEDDEVARLVKPESNISLGVGHVSGDNQRFGMFNGLAKEGTYGIGGFSVIRRDDDTGTWLRAQGRNLGLSNAELRLERERAGQYQYFIELDQLTRQNPYQIRSGLQGAGTNNLTVRNPAAVTTLPDFKIERVASKLGFSHYFNPELEFKVLFQNTEKKGERMFGRGTTLGGGVQEFLAEPVNHTMRQLDAILNYTGDKLQLSGGYYGSWFLNNNNQLNIQGGNAVLSGGAAAINTISLPPDNHAHQLHLSGGYQFTRQTQGKFKVAYTTARQTDSFVNTTPLTNTSGRSDLGGRVDTTLVQLGVTSRPISKLSVLGNVRYENRDDQTPMTRYFTVNNAAATLDGFNEPRSLNILSGKLEASYLLPQGFRVTGGVDAEQKERSMVGVRIVGYREKTEENSYRVELQRSLADALNGSIAYIYSERTGSGYRDLRTLNTTVNPPVLNPVNPAINHLQPIYIADRDREKIRMFFDWNPVEALNLQLAVEDSRDKYGAGRSALNIGARSGDAILYSLDATWTLNDRWRLNGWVSRTETRIKQATGLAAASVWNAALDNYVDAYGVGIKGKVTGAIDVGADAILSKDVSRYALSGTPVTAANALPDIKYDQTTLKFFGRYAYTKDTSFRLDYIFDHRKNNDWTWNGAGTANPFTYSTDGTRLFQRPEDTVHFIGLSVNYAFR